MFGLVLGEEEDSDLLEDFFVGFEEFFLEGGGVSDLLLGGAVGEVLEEVGEELVDEEIVDYSVYLLFAVLVFEDF